MIEHWSFLCSPAYSYEINYKIQYELYNWLDKNTEKAQWLRLPGVAVWYVSNVITAVMRTSAIAEVFFKGLYIIFTAPCTRNCTSNARAGMHELFIHMPKNVLRLIYVIVELAIGIIEILVEPKLFTMDMTEAMKINLQYARAGQLHSKQHADDLRYVESLNKPKFMAYQDRARKRHDPDYEIQYK